MAVETAGRFLAETIEAGELASTHSLEWHRARQTGSGGSDLYPLISGQARRIYDEKTRPVIDDGSVDVDRYRGHVMEPLLRGVFRQATGRIVRRHGMRRHREEPWAIVNADGQVLAQEEAPTAGLEIKAPRQMMMSKILDGGYRIKTALQMQWGMHVTGYDEWFYLCGNLESSPPFVLFTVERDGPMITELAAIVQEFWRGHVEPRIAPENEAFEILGAEIMDAAQDLEPERYLLSSADFELEALAYAEARALEKEAKKDKAEAAAAIKLHLGALGLKEGRTRRWKTLLSDVADTRKLDVEALVRHGALDRDAFVRWAREVLPHLTHAEIDEEAVRLALEVSQFETVKENAPRLGVTDLKGDL